MDETPPLTDEVLAAMEAGTITLPQPLPGRSYEVQHRGDQVVVIDQSIVVQPGESVTITPTLEQRPGEEEGTMVWKVVPPARQQVVG